MRKIIYMFSVLSMYFCMVSCSSEDFGKTILLIDVDNQENPDDPNPDPDIIDLPPPGSWFEGVACIDGSASGAICDGYDLVSWTTLQTFGDSTGNDCWGWTDPETGIEYAILGLSNGTVFIDITSDPPNYVAKINGNGSPSTWRDIKVFNNHAYIVSESSGHGMQVFDMTQLRDITDFPQNLNADMTYTGFGSAHNIVINEDTGFAYAVGTDTFNGGAHFIDLSNPANPIGVGGYSDGYTHDAQVIIYNGPDTDYIGKEIYIGSNESEVVFVDVTDKANPQLISSITYSNASYTHQGWFTEDHKFFIVGDELDELNNGTFTKTIILDATDLDNPNHYFNYIANNSSIDHNGYVKGNNFYLASYTAGMRVLDISNIENGEMTEVGFFDVHPSDNNANFDGAWSVYPFFESGKILISDIVSGFFIVKKQE